jgi:predicted nucleic acid-binding protein
MLTPDSSVVIPLLDSSHEFHEQATAFMENAGDLRLIAHVALESYHVLTRVRPYRRLPPHAVAGALRDSFPGALVGLPAEDHWALVEQAPRLGIVGGAVFDAFIATTASRAGLTLVSRDRRAASTYAAVGADCQLLPI